MAEDSSIEREGEKQPGVVSVNTENNHCRVRIRWVDGEESEMHFPTRGFPVINPETHQQLGFLKGDHVLEILQRETPKKKRTEIHWTDYLENHPA